jgi:chromosome partitioning protein
MGPQVKTLAIVSQKGGVGKTTLATGLAVASERAGARTAIFDVDPQGSAAFWNDTRQAEAPAVVAVPPVRLAHMLKAATEAGTDLVIVDAPPVAKDIAFQAVENADFILVPTRPAVLDVMATTETLKLIKRASDPPKPSAVVVTFCPTQGREVADTENAIRQLGAILAPVRIHNRVAYSRAQQTGLTATEFEPDGKAALEIQRLYEFVCMHIYGQRSMAA